MGPIETTEQSSVAADLGVGPAAAEDRFEALLQHSSDIVVVHRHGILRYLSPSISNVLGWGPEELVGLPVTMIVHPDDQERLDSRIAERRNGIPTPSPGRYRLLHRDGGWRWISTVSTPHLDDPAIDGIVVNCRDITAEMEAQEALRLSEARHRALVEHLSDLIIVTDASGNIDYASPPIVRLLGFTPEVVRGQTIYDGMHPDDHDAGLRHLQQAVAGGPGLYGPHRFRYLHADGGWRYLEVSASNRLADPSVAGLVFVVRDVTRQHELEEQLRHLALHDPLTGLANRALLREDLRTALAGGRRNGSTTALLVIDLDRFKEVNDCFGHEVGDSALIEVASRMERTLRQVDTIARFGGDEFAAVLPDVGSDSPAIAAAHRLAATICEPLTLPGAAPGETVCLGASIGIALAPAHGDDIDTLFRHADSAMYRAKNDGVEVMVAGTPT